MTTETQKLNATDLGEFVRVDRTSNAEDRPPMRNSPVVSATLLHEPARVELNGVALSLPKDQVIITYMNGEQAHMRKEIFGLKWTRKR